MGVGVGGRHDASAGCRRRLGGRTGRGRRARLSWDRGEWRWRFGWRGGRRLRGCGGGAGFRRLGCRRRRARIGCGRLRGTGNAIAGHSFGRCGGGRRGRGGGGFGVQRFGGRLHGRGRPRIGVLVLLREHLVRGGVQDLDFRAATLKLLDQRWQPRGEVCLGATGVTAPSRGIPRHPLSKSANASAATVPTVAPAACLDLPRIGSRLALARGCAYRARP